MRVCVYDYLILAFMRCNLQNMSSLASPWSFIRGVVHVTMRIEPRIATFVSFFCTCLGWIRCDFLSVVNVTVRIESRIAVLFSLCCTCLVSVSAWSSFRELVHVAIGTEARV